jgi:hypothetical protein
MKQALGLVLALSAVSCGDSEPVSDTYQGYIDASALDAKFRPIGSNTTYVTQIASVNGDPVVFYNFGLVANPNTDKSTLPAIAVESLAATVYEFPDGCISGGPYDLRAHAYAPDRQYAVFNRLPLANTSSTAPAVLPLVNVVQWKGSENYDCNAIKDAKSVDEGKFSVTRQDETSVALKAVISQAEVRLANGTPYVAPLGWYKGLLLNYLDAGEVPVDVVTKDDVEQRFVRPMDGVIVNPTTGTASAVTANNVLVLRARPGEVGWSPVVRLRTVTAAAGTTPSSYRSLCYDPPCAAGTVDVSPAVKPNYAGTLFLIGGAP